MPCLSDKNDKDKDINLINSSNSDKFLHFKTLRPYMSTRTVPMKKIKTGLFMYELACVRSKVLC